MPVRWIAILALSLGLMRPAFADGSTSINTAREVERGGTPSAQPETTQRKACGPLPCSGLERRSSAGERTPSPKPDQASR